MVMTLERRVGRRGAWAEVIRQDDEGVGELPSTPWIYPHQQLSPTPTCCRQYQRWSAAASIVTNIDKFLLQQKVMFSTEHFFFFILNNRLKYQQLSPALITVFNTKNCLQYNTCSKELPGRYSTIVSVARQGLSQVMLRTAHHLLKAHTHSLSGSLGSYTHRWSRTKALYTLLTRFVFSASETVFLSTYVTDACINCT